MSGNVPYGTPYGSGIAPAVSSHFAVMRWNENSAEQLKRELLKAIVEDPEIDDSTNIGLDITHEKDKVSEIAIVGAVSSERDRQRAQRIVEVNTHDEVAIRNELKVP